MFSATFQRKYLVLYIVGLLLLVATAWLWWTKISLQPERVFWGMIEQSLHTRGVTMQSVQEDANATLEQTIQYSLGAQNRAISHTVVTQQDTMVSTEVIGTPEADYLRYKAVKSTLRDANDQPLDFSKVVGVWAKSDGSFGESRLFGQALLGLSLPLGAVPVPIGDVTPKATQELLDYIHTQEIYKTDFSKAKKETSHGRTYIIYDVEIQTIAYVDLMKRFSKAVGLHELDQLDPNSYQGAAPMKVTLKVDARSKHLVEVRVGEFTQKYTGYDVPVASILPKEFITNTELQQRLDELQ